MRLNLHVKITLVFGVILAVILLGIFLYLDHSLRQNTYSRIEENLRKQTLLAQSFLEEYFSKDFGYDELDAIADQIGEDLKLRATIIGLDGTVLGDSQLDGKALYEVENHLYRPEVQEALYSGIGQSRRFSTTVTEELLYIATVFGEPKSEGVVRLSLPLSDIQLISLHLKKILFVAFICAFVMAIVISFIALVFVSKPIKQAAEAAKSIAAGDFSHRIWVATNDEIGDLAKTINSMSEQIRLRMEEVMTSTARLKAVLLSMFEGVMVVDSAGTILLMNRTLRKFWSLEAEPVGKKPLEVVRNIEIQEITDEVLRNPYGLTRREISVIVEEERTLLVYATGVIREERIDGAVLVFHDITELKKLERIRQDFVANVSHELRTPIASIKGYAETLLEGALEDTENAEDFVKIIYADADRLARLIDDTLDLSKIESGKLSLAIQPHNLKLLIQRLLGGLRREAGKHSIRIEESIPDTLPAVLADANRLAQVLLNLLDNAVKYNRPGGTITVTAIKEDDFVRISVSDTGIGIPPKDLPRLFERFYRVDKARSRELGGTGLGLSIVKHIVSTHRGEVFVESTPGEGSTFSFTIPCA